MLIDSSASPQEARSLMPCSLKTEIDVSMNLRLFIRVRTYCVSSSADETSYNMILYEFKSNVKVIFDEFIINKEIYMNSFVCLCSCLSGAVKDDSISTLGIWVPAIVSVVSLIVNTVFTVYILPKIAARNNQKTTMYNICSEFFDYLTEIVSLQDFNNVPSTVRKYSLKIHLMFKTGVAPKRIADRLEDIFQQVKIRKGLSDESAISSWEKNFRDKVRELRVELSQYVGVFNTK